MSATYSPTSAPKSCRQITENNERLATVAEAEEKTTAAVIEGFKILENNNKSQFKWTLLSLGLAVAAIIVTIVLAVLFQQQ